MCDEWLKNMDEGKITGLVSLDIKKAFDSINHQILMSKMKDQFGIRENELNWFTSYLTDRQQVCCVNDHISCWKSIESGVPQGSILGPLMFLLYTRNTCMQQPLALVSKQLYFPNMKYLKIVVILTLSIFLQKNVKIMKKL